MKHAFIFAIISIFLFGEINAQGLVFQDSVFTAPVSLSDELEFATFQNCRFVNIIGDALTLNKTGAIIQGCTFENIAGAGIVLDSSEVYILNDTLRHIAGDGIYAEKSTVVLQGCQISDILETALYFVFCDLSEVSDCTIEDVKDGIYSTGPVDGQISILGTHIRRVNGNPSQQGSGTAVFIFETGIVSIEQSSFDSCHAYGIYLDESGIPGQDIVIQDNAVSYTRNNGILGVGTHNAVVRGNEVSYPGAWGGSSDAITSCLFWSDPEVKIEENHFHHAINEGCAESQCRGAGIIVDAPATIARNHIHDCAGDGIRYFYNQDPGTFPLLIFNNVVHDMGGHPVFIDGGGALSNLPEETIIRNNTLHAKTLGNPAEDAPLAVCCNLKPVVVEGNILIYEGVADTSTYVQRLSLDFSDAIVYEALNIKVPGDAGFVDYAARDFHLASSNAPAYNYLPANFGLPNDDFDGNPRIGLHDAGAFELAEVDPICGCSNCPLAIPDLFFGDFIYSVGDIANNDLASPDQGVCGVRVQFEHEYLGDLTMELISPAGQSIQLVGPAGFFGTTDFSFWDVGFVPCTANATPDPGFTAVWNNNQAWSEGGNYTGIYYPTVGCLENFNTGSVTGDWTLRVYDAQAIDTGVVYKFEMLFCDMTAITCQPCANPPQAAFSAIPVGSWAVSLQNQSTGGANQYYIDFGDGATATGHAIPMLHTYSAPGTYIIQLIAINACGADTVTQSVLILGAPPVAFVFAQPETGCVPMTTQLLVIDYTEVDQWHWLCPGGVPSESFEMQPVVQYNTAGNYPISLIISNTAGSDTLQDVIVITVGSGLTNPSFSTTVQGDSIICTNTTQNASSFFWSLNNGNPVGFDTSPQVFEVDSTGLYLIQLTAINDCEIVQVGASVYVEISGTNNLELAGWQFGLSPNPNDGQFNVSVNAPTLADAQWSITNALGETLFTQTIQVQAGSNVYPIAQGKLPSGLYQLYFQTEQGGMLMRFIVR